MIGVISSNVPLVGMCDNLMLLLVQQIFVDMPIEIARRIMTFIPFEAFFTRFFAVLDPPQSTQGTGLPDFLDVRELPIDQSTHRIL